MMSSLVPWLIGLGAVIGAGCVLAIAGALGSVGIETKNPKKHAAGPQTAATGVPGKDPGLDRSSGDHRVL